MEVSRRTLTPWTSPRSSSCQHVPTPVVPSALPPFLWLEHLKANSTHSVTSLKHFSMCVRAKQSLSLFLNTAQHQGPHREHRHGVKGGRAQEQGSMSAATHPLVTHPGDKRHYRGGGVVSTWERKGGTGAGAQPSEERGRSVRKAAGPLRAGWTWWLGWARRERQVSRDSGPVRPSSCEPGKPDKLLASESQRRERNGWTLPFQKVEIGKKKA